MRYLIIIFLSGLCTITTGQTAYRLASFSLVIKGTSNLHPWESKSTDVRANGSITADATNISAIQSLTVEVPAKSIKSAHGSIMDNKTYDALKADAHANIVLKLISAKIENKPDGASITATCNLTIAGVTNKVDIIVKGKVNADGTIKFSGAKKIKMTNFGIKPPTALLGTMTVGDEVEIVFSVTLKK